MHINSPCDGGGGDGGSSIISGFAFGTFLALDFDFAPDFFDARDFYSSLLLLVNTINLIIQFFFLTFAIIFHYLM